MSLPVPIRIYIHFTLINHYLELLEEIMMDIDKSGLYDVCEGVYFGTLGEVENLEKFNQVLAKYPKAKAVLHDTDKNIYEFHTLRFMKKDADELPLFYGLYHHSKGITYPKEKGERNFWYDGNWGRYMRDWLVYRWEKCYHALDMKHYGYDLVGVRAVPKRFSASNSTHFSGNSWWFNSEYLKTIDPIDTFHTWDKFWGELAIYTKDPLMYCMCNEFMTGFPENENYWDYIKRNPTKEEYIL